MLAVDVDGRDEYEWIEDAEGRVSILFDDPYERAYQDASDEGIASEEVEAYVEERVDSQAPESWCNGAGVDVRAESVQVWISTGDPRGAFVMEMRKLEDGRMVIHLPHAGEMLPHEETEELHPGTLVVKRSLS